jgi:hypothetical protein
MRFDAGGSPHFRPNSPARFGGSARNYVQTKCQRVFHGRGAPRDQRRRGPLGAGLTFNNDTSENNRDKNVKIDIIFLASKGWVCKVIAVFNGMLPMFSFLQYVSILYADVELCAKTVGKRQAFASIFIDLSML